MCLNGTYPFLSATLVRQLPYYLFRETCFMDSYPQCAFYSNGLQVQLGGEDAVGLAVHCGGGIGL